MKRLLSLLTFFLLTVLFFEGCEQEDFILPEESAFPNLEQIPTTTEDVFTIDLDKLTSSSAETKSSWTYLTDFNFTRSTTGWHQFANIPSNYFSNYEFRLVQRQVSRQAYLASVGITSSNNAYIIEGDHIYPNTNQERILSQDEMISSSDRGAYFVYTFTSSTSYEFDLYYRVRSAPPTTPSGYSLFDSGNGVQLYKKNGSNVYIQRVDLNRAHLEFKTCPLDNPPCYDCGSQYEVPNYLLNYNAGWFHNNHQNQSGYFSMVNGAFFATSGNRWGSISFPIKEGNFISHGHDNSASKRPYTRAFALSGSNAYVFDYQHGDDIRHSTVESSFDGYGMVIVGFRPSTGAPGTRPSDYTGRTMIAKDRNSRNIIYIYSASSRRTTTAKQEFMAAFNINESDIVMLDGGGSSSLYTKEDNSLIYASRRIPNMVAVYED